MGGSYVQGSDIRYCCNYGDIISEGVSTGTGGISGSVDNVFSCYNFGNVIDKSGFSNIGGIVGSCGQDRNIGNCYSGTIEVKSLEKGSGTYTGGIVGDHRGTILNCYNLSNVSDNNNAGGINGGSGGSVKGVINNCYSLGKITGKQSGGISASSKVETSNCFYLKGTAPGGVNSVDITGQAEPLEKSEKPSVIEVIQNQIEVNGEMINVWKEDTNNINNGYPILYWQ